MVALPPLPGQHADSGTHRLAGQTELVDSVLDGRTNFDASASASPRSPCARPTRQFVLFDRVGVPMRNLTVVLG